MTPKPPQKLTRDEAIVFALASGASWRSAAKQSGTSHSTVARRMACPKFRQQVTERRKSFLDEVSGRLTAMMRDAARTLKQLLKSESDQVKLGAARCILDTAISIRAATDLEERLAKLESAAK